jgi:hypothetical protein
MGDLIHAHTAGFANHMILLNFYSHSPQIIPSLHNKNSGESRDSPRQGVHQLSTSYGSNSKILLKGNTVVQEYAVILPARITDTVPGVKNTVLRQRKRQTRGHVTEPVGSAQPIGHKADPGM